MSEAVLQETETEKEALVEDEKDTEELYTDADNGEKRLIEIEDAQGLDEKCYKTTHFQTLMHLLKVSIGTGILGLPVAVMNAGVVVGPIALLIIAIATTHCMLILVDSARELCKLSGKTSLDYGETAEESVRLVSPKHARVGRYTVNVVLCITQVGVCTVYVLFVARNIEQVLNQLHIIELSVKIWILVLCPIILAFIMIRNLSSLAWVSTMANMLMAFGVLSIFVYLIPNARDPTELPKFGGWSVFPLFFGVAVFAFEAIPIVLPLENEMKEPKYFPNVVKLGMTIVVVVYISMGFFGYLTCLNDCEGSITLNLPGTPFFSVVKLLVAVSVFFSYFIQAYVPLKIVEPWIFEQIPEKMHYFTDTLIRILLVVFTCGLAAAVPQLDNIISLVGALSMSVLGFVCPVTIHLLTFYDKLSRLVIAKNVAIFFFGILGCLAGSYTAIYNIIKEIQTGES